MSSSEFELLRANIGSLKTSFLDFGKRDDGEYSDADRMKCRAFIAFSHAEFEHYLESLSLRILDQAIKKWKMRNELGVVAASILAFRRRDKTSVPADPKQPGNQNTLSTILMEAFNTQKNVINRNHGIKPSNFAEIFTPLGVTEADVEEVLLIQLGNAGARRGDMVHKSSNVSLLMIRDPFDDELMDVDALEAELCRFDERLEQLNFYSSTDD